MSVREREREREKGREGREGATDTEPAAAGVFSFTIITSNI